MTQGCQIVGGTVANTAAEAALAAYAGGVVDRVVRLSKAKYEVHNIGVNWPHHIFINQDSRSLAPSNRRSTEQISSDGSTHAGLACAARPPE